LSEGLELAQEQLDWGLFNASRDLLQGIAEAAGSAGLGTTVVVGGEEVLVSLHLQLSEIERAQARYGAALEQQECVDRVIKSAEDANKAKDANRANKEGREGMTLSAEASIWLWRLSLVIARADLSRNLSLYEQTEKEVMTVKDMLSDKVRRVYFSILVVSCFM